MVPRVNHESRCGILRILTGLIIGFFFLKQLEIVGWYFFERQNGISMPLSLATPISLHRRLKII
jgi:hypothetical protein